MSSYPRIQNYSSRNSNGGYIHKSYQVSRHQNSYRTSSRNPLIDASTLWIEINVYRKNIDEEAKKYFLDTKKNFKKLAKQLIVPEGYFRSIITGRLVKDTEKNRYRDTLPPESFLGSRAHIYSIVDEIDKQITPELKIACLEKHNITEAVLKEIESWDTPWEYLPQISKFIIIKKSIDSIKKVKLGNYDEKAPKREKKEQTEEKKLKIRNMLEYVDRPSASEGSSDSDSNSDDDTPKKSLTYFDEALWENTKLSPKITLHPYQNKVIDHMKDHRGVIMSFDTGAGKTITSVVTSLCLLKTNTVEKVIVVAPKSLYTNFQKELGYYLTQKDILHQKFEYYTHSKFVLDFENNYNECDNSLIIVDEASEFRTAINPSGQKGKSAFTMINCCIRAKRVLCLSATPLFNEFADVVNLIAMVKGEPPKMVPGTEAGKLHYTKDLFAFHNLREDSSKDIDLPTRREHVLEFEMTPEYYLEYLKIQRSTNDITKDPFCFLTGLRHGTNCIKPNPKIEWALDRIQEKKLKTILFSSFIDDGIRLLQEGLDSRDIKYVTISGELSMTIRQEAVKEYNDPTSDVLVMIISQAGSLGLDLKKTREVIFIEANWNPAQEEQVIGRACRLGSHTGLSRDEYFVDIYRLYLFKPPLEKLDEGDNYPSGDAILKGIMERKKKILDKYYYLLRSQDIDPEKAFKYSRIYEEMKKPGSSNLKQGFGEPLPPPPSIISSGLPAVFYDTLGVPYGSSVDDCRRAFKKLSLTLHPDRNYNATHDERQKNLEKFKKALDALEKIIES